MYFCSRIFSQLGCSKKRAEIKPIEPDRVIPVREYDDELFLTTLLTPVQSDLNILEMMYTRFLFFSLVLALCFLPCKLAAQLYELNFKVSGDDLAPLQGVNITLIGHGQTYDMHTDRDGNVRFQLHAPGTYRYEARMLGYAGIRSMNDLVMDVPQKTILLSLQSVDFFLDAALVESTRSSASAPIAHTTLQKDEIEAMNEGQDIPFILQHLPSVVVSSDAGAGIGYTAMRIRGVDTRSINVTINGIPYNDSESQGVFWVNMPDLSSSLQSIQVQRGIGASTHGTGAFGATVNLETNRIQQNAYAQTLHTFGSFNTRKHNVQAGIGLIGSNFYLESRLSTITSDGFIDRASSDLSSYFVQGGWISGNSALKAIVFGGRERTYQAWYGIPVEMLETEPTYNPAGAIYDAEGGLTGYYDNQTDNYRQDHLQLHGMHRFNNGFVANIGLHATLGNGYYEEYRNFDRFSNYGIEPVVFPDDTISRTDLIRRLWLDNNFTGAVFSLNREWEQFNLTIGGGLNRYEGDHYGEVLWTEVSRNFPYEYRFYDNTGIKWDGNLFVRGEWSVSRKFNLFGDIQGRYVDYALSGTDRNVGEVDFTDELLFINPKVGFLWRPAQKHAISVFYGVSKREPARRDYLDSPSGQDIQPERLQNVEVNHKFKSSRVLFETNLFGMFYRNQLVLTGQLSDTGMPIRDNSGQSYRAGVEWMLAWKLHEDLVFNTAITLSKNRNIDYTFQNPEGMLVEEQSTPISFSPEVIAKAGLNWSPVSGLVWSVLPAYIGAQHLANENVKELMLDAYYTIDSRIRYSIPAGFFKQVDISLLVNNLTNNRYASNAYGYRYAAGGETIHEMFVYPQAGINFLASLTLNF